MSEIMDAIIDYQDWLRHLPVNPHKRPVDKRKFTLLLSGISSARKVPGITEHMGFSGLYHCSSASDTQQVAAHLKRMLKISDKESLLKACQQQYDAGTDYEQFLTFWKEAPAFSLDKLTEEGKKAFLRCKDLAEPYYPFVKEKGLYAWDINEKIGLCRLAVAAEIISEEEFFTITDDWVRQALVFYHSYEEYALSCLCGAAYFIQCYEKEALPFIEINKTVLNQLLEEEGAWYTYAWYVPQEREVAVLINGNPGCIVSKKAISDGRIGYMFRDEPIADRPDCGWRFYAGDEPQEDAENLDQLVICGLNTICNLQPDIMPYIYAQQGRVFKKYGDSWEEED